MTTDTIEAIHDPALVALSMTVAVLASFVAFDVAGRIMHTTGWRKLGWIAAAATAMGGGIWSMHFVAMLAFSLPIDVGYDVGITLLSLAVAIGVTAVAFVIVSDGPGVARLLGAGAIMGSGVAVMHYTGMAAMRMPAVIEYTPWLVALSVVIAFVAATAALWVATSGSDTRWRLFASIIMGAAISGMHYTGMAAACFTEAPSLMNPGGVRFERVTLAAVIAVGTIVILGLELISAVVDRKLAALRRREEEILRLAARRFRLLVQSSNDLIIVVDRIGRIQYATPSSRSLLGVEPADLEGRNVFEFLGGNGVPNLRDVLAAEEARRAWAYVDDLQITDSAGTTRDFELTACNLLDEPSVGGIVLTFHDVTDRQRATEELRRAKLISDQANRMKSAFIANVSHELRTPLNAIIGFSEMMMREVKGPLGQPVYRDYAADIHRSGQQLLAIVNDILDMSRIEAGELRLREVVLDPAQLVEESIRVVMPAAVAKSLHLDGGADPEVSFVLGDEVRLHQILGNLLTNAVKFTPPGGSVTVLAYNNPAGEVEFAVRDTGVGIPPDQIERIFQPFVQVDNSLARAHEGCGLGLAIAQSLAKLHGGCIEIRSEVNRGTDIRLILPRERARDRRAAA